MRADIDAATKKSSRSASADADALKLLEAEQHREDAQRALYLNHRSVSELAGQLQGSQSRLESAQARVGHIDRELATLAQTLDEAQAQTRESRTRLEQAVARMGELETERQQLDSQRRQLSIRAMRRGTRRASHATNCISCSWRWKRSAPAYWR